MKINFKFDSMVYGAAVLGERALGLMLLPLLTKHLSAEEYGIWAQTLVASGVLMPLIVACLPAAVVKFFSGQSAWVRRRWLFRMLGLVVLVIAVLGVGIACGADSVAHVVYGGPLGSNFVSVLLVLMAAEALMDLLIAFLRAGGRMPWIAFLIMGRGLLRIGFMALALIALGWEFHDAFLGLVFLQLLFVVLLLAHELFFRRVEAVTALPGAEINWKDISVFVAPLVLVSILTSINGFADRFVLTHLLGLEKLAVYAAVSSLVSVASVAYSVLGFALFPILARHWGNGDFPQARKMTQTAMLVFLFIAAPYVFWLSGSIGSLLPLLTASSYRVGGFLPALVGMAIIGFGLYQIMLYVLLLEGRGFLVVWMMLAAALLNLILNFLLVPRWELLGAAFASALSSSLLAVVAHQAVKIEFPWGQALKIFATALMAGCAAFAVNEVWQHHDWVAVVLGLLLSVSIFFGVDFSGRDSMVRAFFNRKIAS